MMKQPANRTWRAWQRISMSGRLALFVAALAPMTIWILSGAVLARPFEVLTWTLLCACLAASLPGRGTRLSAWVVILLLPWTLAWVGTVAVTGAGPSNAVMDSAVAGALHEVWTGMQLAAMSPAFIAVALMTIATCVWAVRANLRAQKSTGNLAGVVFLCCLAPISAVLVDAGGHQSFARIAGPEPRISVAWLSHLGLAKEAISAAVNQAVFGRQLSEQPVRNASTAARQFDAMPGLGVFIVSESLRADALVAEGRGRWSTALRTRIENGLGVRLPDACAGANSTFASVPRLLTAVDIADVSGAAGNPTLLALAKAGGAKTAYINNQEIWVLPESGHDLLHKTSSMEVHAYDEVVVEVLADFVKRSASGPKAALLHLYGVHFHYEDRYPPDLFEAEPLGMSGASLAEFRYARAAEYGLRVLMLAAAILDDQATPAFLVFTSDHGENLPSDGSGKRYHAGPSSGRNDTIVPTLVLWNEAFRASGRTEALKEFAKKAGTLIAHRDVARLWLTLEGHQGKWSPTVNPMTWAALNPGERVGPVSCADLGP